MLSVGGDERQSPRRLRASGGAHAASFPSVVVQEPVTPRETRLERVQAKYAADLAARLAQEAAAETAEDDDVDIFFSSGRQGRQRMRLPVVKDSSGRPRATDEDGWPEEDEEEDDGAQLSPRQAAEMTLAERVAWRKLHGKKRGARASRKGRLPGGIFDSTSSVPALPLFGKASAAAAADGGGGTAGKAGGATDKHEDAATNLCFRIMMELQASQIEEMRERFEQAADGSLDLYHFIIVLRDVLGGNRMLAELDREEDVVARLTELFSQIDINGDGSVDWDEFSGFIITGTEKIFSQIDLGEVSVERYLPTSKVGRMHLSDEPERVRQVDGGGIIACGRDGTAYVLDEAHGLAVQRRLRGHRSVVLDAVRVKGHGHASIVTSSADRTMMVWDGVTYQRLASVPTGDPQLCMAADPERRQLFTGSTTGMIQRWSVPTIGAPVREDCVEQAHSNWVTDLLRLGELGLLVSASLDRTVRIWDTATLKLKREQVGHAKGVYALGYSPDYRILFSGGFEHDICVWNPFVRGLTHRMTGHENSILSIHGTDNSPQVTSCDIDGVIKIWDVRTYQCMQTISQHDAGPLFVPNPKAMCVLNESKQIVTFEKRCYLFSPQQGDDVPNASLYAITHVLFNRVFNTIMVAAGVELTIWSAETGRFEASFELEPGTEITTMCMDDRERQLILGTQNGLVLVYTIANQALAQSFTASRFGAVTHCYFRSSPRALVVATLVDGIALYDIGGIGLERVLQRVPPRTEAVVKTIEYAHDRHLVAISYTDHLLQVWKMDSGSMHANVPLEYNITTMAFAEPIEALLAFDDAGLLSVFTVNTLERLMSVRVDYGITSMVFYETDGLLLTVDDSKRVRMLDLHLLQNEFYKQNEKLGSDAVAVVSRFRRARTFPRLVPGGHRAFVIDAPRDFVRHEWLPERAATTAVAVIEQSRQSPAIMLGSLAGDVDLWSPFGRSYGYLARRPPGLGSARNASARLGSRPFSSRAPSARSARSAAWTYPLDVDRIDAESRENLQGTMENLARLEHELASQSDASGPAAAGSAPLLPPGREYLAHMDALAPFFTDCRKAALGPVPTVEPFFMRNGARPKSAASIAAAQTAAAATRLRPDAVFGDRSAAAAGERLRPGTAVKFDDYTKKQLRRRRMRKGADRGRGLDDEVGDGGDSLHDSFASGVTFITDNASWSSDEAKTPARPRPVSALGSLESLRTPEPATLRAASPFKAKVLGATQPVAGKVPTSKQRVSHEHGKLIHAKTPTRVRHRFEEK